MHYVTSQFNGKPSVYNAMRLVIYWPMLRTTEAISVASPMYQA